MYLAWTSKVGFKWGWGWMLSSFVWKVKIGNKLVIVKSRMLDWVEFVDSRILARDDCTMK